MFKKRTLIKKKRSFKRRTPGGGVVTRPSLYRSLNSERRQIHKHVMGYVYTTALNTQTGWSGTVNSQSIQFFFVFDGLWVQVGGNAAVFVGSFDNTAYLTGIYEKYRIKKVVCEIVCGSNNSPVNSTTQFSTGANTSGQTTNTVGLTGMYNASSPVQVGTSSWNVAAAGVSHTTALKNDGTLWAWGGNSIGQLGNNDGALASQSSPIQIGTSSWNAVYAGYNYTYALSSNGLLYGWGSNANNQLVGLTYTPGLNNASSPVQVGTSTWNLAIAGQSMTMAIRTDNTLWGWGYGISGVLGINNNVNYSSPTQIGTNSWLSIATGAAYTIATDSTSKLYGWGTNAVGQLGAPFGYNFTYGGNAFSPIQVGTSSWSAVAAAPTASHTAAIRSDGTLFMWGNNAVGQLGTAVPVFNGAANTSSPTQVNFGSWGSTP